jgi:hypothetical protein
MRLFVTFAAAASITLLASTATVLPSQTPAPAPPTASPPFVRGLYVNRYAAESDRKMRHLIALADTTEINAFVIDLKDEFGINYESRDTLVRRNAGRGGVIADLPALLDTLHAHHIMAIARIVVFKDSVTARLNPAWVIRKGDGTPWHDKKGIAWVNPYNHDLWEYDLRVAEDAARMGFGEVQFDYIRFPEPYKSLPTQVFPGAGDVPKPVVLAEFLKTARARLAKYNVRTTADIFGLVTSVPGALEVGQQWEDLAQSADVLLPMVYPSHYPHGSFGFERPNAEPYGVVTAAVASAYKRNAKLGLSGERVRPWLQAFTLGSPAYGPDQLMAQKKAVYDAGYDGWVLWSPGSRYDGIAAGLERHGVSHKKTAPAGATTVAAAPVTPVAARRPVTATPTATP